LRDQLEDTYGYPFVDKDVRLEGLKIFTATKSGLVPVCGLPQYQIAKSAIAAVLGASPLRSSPITRWCLPPKTLDKDQVNHWYQDAILHAMSGPRDLHLLLQKGGGMPLIPLSIGVDMGRGRCEAITSTEGSVCVVPAFQFVGSPRVRSVFRSLPDSGARWALIPLGSAGLTLWMSRLDVSAFQAITGARDPEAGFLQMMSYPGFGDIVMKQCYDFAIHFSDPRHGAASIAYQTGSLPTEIHTCVTQLAERFIRILRVPGLRVPPIASVPLILSPRLSRVKIVVKRADDPKYIAECVVDPAAAALVVTLTTASPHDWRCFAGPRRLAALIEGLRRGLPVFPHPALGDFFLSIGRAEPEMTQQVLRYAGSEKAAKSPRIRKEVSALLGVMGVEADVVFDKTALNDAFDRDAPGFEEF
jgi:hypothetical protein